MLGELKMFAKYFCMERRCVQELERLHFKIEFAIKRLPREGSMCIIKAMDINGRKGSVLVIVLIVLVVLAAIGGVWYYKAHNNPIPHVPTQSVSIATSTSMTAPIAEPAPASTSQLPEVSFSIAPSTVVAGEGATLTWSSTNTTSCGFTGTNAAFSNTSWSDEGLSSSGSKVIIPYYSSPAAYTAQYQIVCTGPSGTSAPVPAGLTVLSVPPSSQPHIDPTSVMLNEGPGPGISVVVVGTGIGSSSTIQISGNGYSTTLTPSLSESWEGATEKIDFDLPTAIANSTSTYSVEVVSGGISSNPVNITPIQNAQG
jgi:hypothetical protein